jgi:hypothetical protein
MVCTLGFEVKVYALEIGVGTFDLWLEHVFVLLAWGFRVRASFGMVWDSPLQSLGFHLVVVLVLRHLIHRLLLPT